MNSGDSAIYYTFKADWQNKTNGWQNVIIGACH